MAASSLPYNRAIAITKSDSVDILPAGPLTGAIYVGGAGIVAAVMEDNTVVNFTAVAGGLLPIRARRVNSTTTTATLMVALYKN